MNWVKLSQPAMASPALALAGSDSVSIEPSYPVPYAEYRFNEGAGQVLIDSIHGNNGQLGSAVGTDTNDPSWANGGLSFLTDDYVKLPLAINPEADFTTFIVANVAASAPAGTQFYWSGGNSGVNTQYVGVSRRNDGNLRFSHYNNAAQDSYASILSANVVPGIRLLKEMRSANVLTLKDIGSGQASLPVAASASPCTLNVMAFGCLYRTFGALNLSQSIYWAEFFQRATTEAEDQQIFNYIKSNLLTKGVQLA
jgi:hypothetical protein